MVDEECAGGANPSTTALVERWLAHRNDVSALAPLWRGGIVVDTVEVAGRWAVLPALADEVVGGTAENCEGTLVASVAPEPRLHRRGLPVLHLRRPAGRPMSRAPTAEPAWQQEYYRTAWDTVTATHRGATVRPSATTTGSVSTGPASCAGALGDAFGVLGAVKRRSIPDGILNPGKLGLPSAFGPVPWP